MVHDEATTEASRRGTADHSACDGKQLEDLREQIDSAGAMLRAMAVMLDGMADQLDKRASEMLSRRNWN